MEDNNQLVYSAEVLEFAGKANTFVRFVESDGFPAREEFMPLLLNLLTSLYASFIVVPRNEPVFEEGNEKFVTEEDWAAVYQKITVALGRHNDYLDIPDEDEYDRSELVRRKISEDIADIYQDVRDFLELYRVGTEEIMNDALWDCRISFESYWGKKVLRAAAALHQAYRNLLKGSEDAMDTGTEGDTRLNTDNWFISMRQKEMGGGDELPE